MNKDVDTKKNKFKFENLEKLNTYHQGILISDFTTSKRVLFLQSIDICPFQLIQIAFH